MNTPTRLGAYALGLAAVFGTTVGIGHAVGPIGHDATAPGTAHVRTEGSKPSVAPISGAAPAAATGHVPGGLAVSVKGHTLEVARLLTAGPATPVRFRVLGPDGQAVTAYDKAHDKDLHLIAVRRDLSGFQHVHPDLTADGTWTTELDLTAGSWRLFADFTPAGGEPVVLGADTSVAGDYQPVALPAPSRTATVDGYSVTLDGDLAVGQDSQVTLTVNKGGQPVTDLQPYLAAYGHLVALRDGDLAYLHVHPAGEPGDGETPAGPGISFSVNAPSAGEYRLFFDFKHGAVVRTAQLTVRAGDASTAPATAPSASPSAGGGHGRDGHSH